MVNACSKLVARQRVLCATLPRLGFSSLCRVLPGLAWGHLDLDFSPYSPPGKRISLLLHSTQHLAWKRYDRNLGPFPTQPGNACPSHPTLDDG
ncbi:hypothetical protein RRG08_025471 [Elysia crispata]|uniref:Uncharacterized protein n=1 Tax=Elysia crispata TaxID=231223 RepID=A0AAE1A7I5_9GAST|nr:hypothetical protein RRG08_025471 [Elysia crispata]